MQSLNYYLKTTNCDSNKKIFRVISCIFEQFICKQQRNKENTQICIDYMMPGTQLPGGAGEWQTIR